MSNILIIGSSSGIGKAIAQYYAKQGHNVAIASRRNHLLKQVASTSPNIIYRRINITDRENCLRHIHSLIKKLGGIDLFINCAAYGQKNYGFNYTIQKETIRTNVAAFNSLMFSMYRYFRKQGRGHLVNISSISGLRGVYHAPEYAASKAYQISLLESLRAKAKRDGFKLSVTDIRPGFVDTAMASGNVFWMASPEKAAVQIAQAIRRKKHFAYITKRWWLIAMLMKLLPSRLIKYIG